MFNTKQKHLATMDVFTLKIKNLNYKILLSSCNFGQAEGAPYVPPGRGTLVSPGKDFMGPTAKPPNFELLFLGDIL